MKASSGMFVLSKAIKGVVPPRVGRWLGHTCQSMKLTALLQHAEWLEALRIQACCTGDSNSAANDDNPEHSLLCARLASLVPLQPCILMSSVCKAPHRRSGKTLCG